MPRPAAEKYFAHFEIDIVTALAEQLVAALSSLTPAPLQEDRLASLDAGQGVYALYRGGTLVYIGKAKSLRTRLKDHLAKIEGRRKITISEMTFSALFVHPNWT